MYELGYDLLLDEEGMMQEAEILAKKAEAFEEGLKNLEGMLKEIRNSAIMEGNAAENLSVFVKEVGMLKGEAERLKEEWKGKVEAYISAMDIADKVLL